MAPPNDFGVQGVNFLERMTGIEPALSAWEADVLPLNYIRLTRHFVRLAPVCYLRRASNVPQASERRNIRLAQVGAHEPDTIALWLAATPGTSSQRWCARSGVEGDQPRMLASRLAGRGALETLLTDLDRT
jgi:hypothetical protein